MNMGKYIKEKAVKKDMGKVGDGVFTGVAAVGGGLLAYKAWELAEPYKGEVSQVLAKAGAALGSLSPYVLPAVITGGVLYGLLKYHNKLPKRSKKDNAVEAQVPTLPEVAENPDNVPQMPQ